jgi:hypothetical protein
MSDSKMAKRYPDEQKRANRAVKYMIQYESMDVVEIKVKDSKPGIYTFKTLDNIVYEFRNCTEEEALGMMAKVRNVTLDKEWKQGASEEDVDKVIKEDANKTLKEVDKEQEQIEGSFKIPKESDKG